LYQYYYYVSGAVVMIISDRASGDAVVGVDGAIAYVINIIML